MAAHAPGRAPTHKIAAIQPLKISPRIRKRLCHDLKLVLIDDISDALRLEHPDSNTMMLEDGNQFAYAGKMFMGSIFDHEIALLFLR